MAEYEFTGEEKVLDDGIVVKRIRRVSDGLVGGWIESELNLSTSGTCFVYDEAVVFNMSLVVDNASARDNVYVSDTVIGDSAVVKGNSRVTGCSVIGNAVVDVDDTEVCDIGVDGHKVIKTGYESNVNDYLARAIDGAADDAIIDEEYVTNKVLHKGRRGDGKYKFTRDWQVVNGHTVRGIRRISDGLIGGWIESEDNLSQQGDCFVYDEAIVYGGARIEGDAEVHDEAEVKDGAVVKDSAKIYGNALIGGRSIVADESRVWGTNADDPLEVYATLTGNTLVGGCGKVSCFSTYTCIKDKILVLDHNVIYGEEI